MPYRGRIALALAVLVSVLALVQAVHKARKGQCALLKWRPQVEALAREAGWRGIAMSNKPTAPGLK